MSPEEVQKRGGVTQLNRAQVKIASQLDWGLELAMTVPQEVRRLAHEVSWKKITQVWDPWAGTGVIGKVMSLEWPHLEIMSNDWNPQLGWPEALNALQPGKYRAWKEKKKMYVGDGVSKPLDTGARMLRGGEATVVGMFTFSMGKFALDGATTEDAEQALI
ncbi:hypothetical protein CYMTET_56033 [Cymbomonas tetramitiformis]|uniref:Methyltransferase n=1 Tax=Cymbomonas tetramitiformis TaxID=36881 RepID=A0AAE0EMD3_9CHLO|nr:hypothetical protein CYMTET_56033 [Cymbomonas tetramitiformis]